MNNAKINSYIQFAVRANKVVWGLDMIKTSKQKPFIILYDKSLGANSEKQLDRYSQEKEVRLVELDENYLNNLLKRQNVKLIGLLDESLSNAIIDNLN